MRQSRSKNFARRSGSRQNGFSASDAAMWFGHDVEHDAEAELPRRRAQRAKRLLAAEVVRDPCRVDDVVAVGRATLRLHDRRQVQVRHAEVGQVRHERGRTGEVEVRAELQPIGGPERRHAKRYPTRRSITIERDSTSIGSRAATVSPPSTKPPSAVESTTVQRSPNRRVGQVERDRLVVAVEEEHERVVAHVLAATASARRSRRRSGRRRPSSPRRGPSRAASSCVRRAGTTTRPEARSRAPCRR